MTIDDIKALIASDESRTLELKKSTGELKDGMHAACAFLNTEGGWLIFGRTPKSLKIIGQQETDDTQREIAQALAGLQPAVDMRPEYIDVPDRPGHKVIAMHFDGWVWGERPHTFHGCPYYKVESTTKVIPQDMYDERIRAFEPKTFSWELRQAEGVTLSDLNEKHIRGCIRMGVEGGRIPASALSAPITDTLSKWKLLKNGIPTNGAAMLFSGRVDEYDNFKIKMARFLGTDKNEFIDEMRVEGNFFDLLDAGLAFCFKHLNLSGKITNRSLQREERLEIPYKALREAIINSLCHRQWEKYNLLNSIAIYDDRVEIGNPGIFPSQITPENIKEPHDSYPYNVKMAEALYRSMWLENWGSGAKRIIEVCQEQGVEDPTWRWDGGFVYVTFKRPSYKSSQQSNEPQINLVGNVALNTQESKGESKENDLKSSSETERVHQKTANSSSESSLETILSSPEFLSGSSENKVMMLLKVNNRMTLDKMAEYLNMTKRGVQKVTNRLQECGVLSRKGSTKAGEWIVNQGIK